MIESFFTSIITSATVSALLTAALVWLTKSVISARLKSAIKSEYDQKLETHKAQLKAQSDVAIEKLKSKLQIASVEHEAKFSRLQEKRAIVIADTYGKLKALVTAIADYTKAFEPVGGLPRDERRVIAANCHTEFSNYYSKNLIFFPRKTANDLEVLNLELIRVFNKFAITVDRQQNTDPTAFDRQMEILNNLDGEIKEALAKLEDDFRSLLGEEC